MKDYGIKLFICLMLLTLVVTTGVFCIKKPQMHKPLSINIIEYIIKINTDGSVTTTKSTTDTGVQVKEK